MTKLRQSLIDALENAVKLLKNSDVIDHGSSAEVIQEIRRDDGSCLAPCVSMKPTGWTQINVKIRCRSGGTF